ncbi:MAG: ABC transporter ATP-binding protein, partial [Pseudomonadota bacterium]
MDSIVLETRELTKRYGATIALDRLDLTVRAGEIVCLLGANGAGKTTTLNLLLGFVKPDGGDALVEGRSVISSPVETRRKLGYVAEVVSLYPALSGAENIAFFSDLAGQHIARDRRDDVLARLRFPLAELARSTGGYSKGMRQKVGLAIALLKGASAILLDELTLPQYADPCGN